MLNTGSRPWPPIDEQTVATINGRADALDSAVELLSRMSSGMVYQIRYTHYKWRDQDECLRVTVRDRGQYRHVQSVDLRVYELADESTMAEDGSVFLVKAVALSPNEAPRCSFISVGVTHDIKPQFAGHVIAVVERMPGQLFSGTLGLLHPSSAAAKETLSAGNVKATAATSPGADP
ncbi:uncharacterized protein HD556DRAFT_1308272 [Suillus plorans]|uniref:Uncharacterized protein n=1 Tax=Suillus plorans TaxID=116603 RepID=A0A9P7AS19_9AGAM|nr:uncharacterized protein HD556DRAFT_1308272 [Suillus plorans]KAG1794223.1 hypothetical protein HD556DRAFT_1308272 [Suillus plorans]